MTETHQKKTDREIWEEHISNWWNQPLTKEQEDEIDHMSEAEVVDFFFSMTGSKAQRNYAAARIISQDLAVGPVGWKNDKK